MRPSQGWKLVAQGGAARIVAPLWALAVLLVIGGAVGAQGPATVVAGASTPQPNIVVIMTDDQALTSFRPDVMPRTTQLIADAGTTFDEYVVSTPLCCPSRATYLTGQYAHNNGVFSNNPGYVELRDKNSTLPTWLGEAGYRTAHVGKFLHGYENSVSDPAAPAPGFDEWHAMLRPFNYFGFDLSANGRRVSYDDERYLTSTLTKKALGVVNRNAAGSRPLFLSVAYWAPHGGGPSAGRCDRASEPAPGDYRLFADEPLPKPPSFNERDVADKPSFVRELPRVSRERTRALERRYRCALASLQEVDRGVRRLYEAFDAVGEADNTVFVFTSDNGFFFGEHRLRGKSLPYEEAIRVPLAVRLPESFQPAAGPVRRSSAPVANVDLAPTILELASAVPCPAEGECRTLDGRSLMPLMRGDEGWPADRGIVLESRKNELDGASCRYTAIRSAGLLYAEHASVLDPRTGECERAAEVERYDLAADPFQLENLHPPPSSSERRYERELSNRLDVLATCAGIEGRDAKPAGGSNCE